MKKPDVVVHGGGFVGLTGAVHHARAGRTVLIYDPDEGVVSAINAGKPKAGEFLGYLGATPEVRWGDNLRATTDFVDTHASPVHVVAVPSEKNGEPYMYLVISVLTKIFQIVHEDSLLVIVESTCTPGTVDKFLSNYPDFLLKGKRPKGDHLAVCPRRDWFSDPSKNLENLTRIVGGVTPECTKRAVAFLSKVSKDIRETDYWTAELTKPLENAFLHVGISLANEIALMYPERDSATAVELACTHWRLMKLNQNIGIGGRCVPLGPRYLQEGTMRPGMVLRAALGGEQEICRRSADAVAQRIKPGGRVLVLGIAYRPEFKDAGSSPGLALAHLLWEDGFRVSVADPMWLAGELQEMARLPAIGMSAALDGDGPTDLDLALQGMFDAVVLATPHQEFSDILRHLMIVKADLSPLKFFLDAQGAYADLREDFKRAGIEYKRVGDAGWVA